MPIDSSIALAARPVQPQDPLEQYKNVMLIKGLTDQGQLSALQRQKLEGDINEEEAVKKLFSGGAKPTVEQVYGASPSRGGAYAKSQADLAKAQSEIGKNNAEILQKSLQVHRDQLASVNTPQDAAQWTMAGFNDPNLSPILQRYGSPDQYIARIPTDPQKFQQWKVQQGLGIEKFVELANKQADQIGVPDATAPGGVRINRPVVEAKKEIATAGSSNISVNTEKSLLGKISDVVGEQIGNQHSAAQGALQTIDTANRLRDAVSSGAVMSGPGANFQVVGAQIAQKLGNGDSPEGLVKTRETIKGLAELALAARASLKGQGQISDYEGKLLQRASTGDIDTLTAPEIKTLADLADRSARITIKQNRANVDKLRKNPNAAMLADILHVEEPGQYQPKTPTPAPGVAPTLPPGVTQADIDAELNKRGVTQR